MFLTRKFWKYARALCMRRHTDVALGGWNQGFLQYGTPTGQNHPSQNAECPHGECLLALGLCEWMNERTRTWGWAGQGTGQAPGSQQGGAGTHGADEVDGQVATAIVGQGEARLSVLQPRDVAGLPQAGAHSLPHLQPLPDVPAQSSDGRPSAWPEGPVGAPCILRSHLPPPSQGAALTWAQRGCQRRTSAGGPLSSSSGPGPPWHPRPTTRSHTSGSLWGGEGGVSWEAQCAPHRRPPNPAH